MAKTQTNPQKPAPRTEHVARPKQIVPLADFIAHGVSPIPNAPAPIGSAVDGYETSFNQQHVNYLGTDNHVHGLVYINSWQHNNLTDL